jgi:heme A synthase
MTPLSNKRFFHWLWFGLILIFSQMILGATVRATGSGMGCPDWPLCHGQFFPALNFESILEYMHRLVGASVSLTVLLTVGMIVLSKTLRAQLLVPAALVTANVIILVVFGAMTVAYDMPPVIVACHLLLASGLLFNWLLMLNRVKYFLALSQILSRPQMTTPLAWLNGQLDCRLRLRLFRFFSGRWYPFLMPV